ncbi:DUF5655 domain-containing protein [Faecalicatena contorta]|uniref:DUF5655 domain-containing protein n=1 Tax=Faecalicatena contorta TaxID=39482 RepID=UPI001F356579|nr:DUF5655 domain-containing protein [Faecalicatena contorta]MCF2682482.1 hypothetical protein [Faecalicatena contorta]
MTEFQTNLKKLRTEEGLTQDQLALLVETSTDILLFFDQHQTILPLYEAFAGEMQVQFPDSKVKVQKTQITFSNRHVFACVSFLRVKKKAELPDDYFVLTLGLPYPLESERVAVKTEPYPGRWTTHIVISKMSDLDEELFAWVAQAYEFSEKK